MRIERLILTAAVLFAVPLAGAEEKTITTPQLIAKLSGPAAKRDFTLLDARTAVEFKEAHIPGAISLPARAVAAQLPKIVKSKAAQVIFYCNGPNCTKSTMAAKAALADGYTNVVEFREGMPGWGESGQKIEGTPLPSFDAPLISAADLKAALAGKDAPVLVDVRDPEEFPGFHIAQAVNVPLDDLAAYGAKKLPAGRAVVVVDHAGHQTLVAGRVLHSLGRADVKRLDGGTLKWQAAGFPVVTR